MNTVSWDYYDKFNDIIKKYLPERGEGDTKATQIVTAINKLIYKWYNDGDVYDNSTNSLGWCNDLSSYANWLAANAEGAEEILDRVFNADEDEYEMILKDLADKYLTEEFLLESNKLSKIGTIYKCEGDYYFTECDDEWVVDWGDEED